MANSVISAMMSLYGDSSWLIRENASDLQQSLHNKPMPIAAIGLHGIPDLDESRLLGKEVAQM